MKQAALKQVLKNHRDVSMTIATSNMQLFVALVSGFHLFTNFSINSILGITRVLDLPLQYYKIF